jgi:ATP/maltotriose-dependent transcriptional regulator MalT
MEALAGELEAGQRALERAKWGAARLSFEAVLERGESAQAREGLGLALWFLGEVMKGISSRECAFELYARAGSGDDAARTAVWVSHQHFVSGRVSAARGWLARAERVLEDVGDCAGHGWVAVERARHATSLEEQITHARRAVEIARSVRASDLEIFAVSVLGRAQVAAGRSEEGLRLLEEAMAGAAGGQVRNIHTLAEAYCNLIIASTNVGDWERATEWCELVDTFARAHEAAPLFGTCRSVHADVLFATGHWVEAERALETSLATHARYVPEMGAPAVASLAELRVRQGRLSEAETLLAGRGENPSSLRVLALLRIAEGRSVAAVALLEHSLVHHGAGTVVGSSQLLAALVDARIACADLPGAQAAVAELVELATASGLRLVAARADLAAARVARVGGDVAKAADQARRALTAFLTLAMPLDAGEARLELAHALASEVPDVAKDEAQTALAVFRQLGAARAVDGAVALLRELAGGTTAHGPHHGTSLTPREKQVLELVAQGLSNARIAAVLVISEKTAGHHVSHILTKLGVHNRTEAATHVRDQR